MSYFIHSVINNGNVTFSI